MPVWAPELEMYKFGTALRTRIHNKPKKGDMGWLCAPLDTDHSYTTDLEKGPNRVGAQQ